MSPPSSALLNGQQVLPSVRIATVINTMQPSERRVAEVIVADPGLVVEITAQELAERVSVARSTVIRACQSLGYRGYPQLRVALAAELAQQNERLHDHGTSALGRIRSGIDALAASLPQIASVLSEGEVDEAVSRVAGARRVMVLASGLSAPLASDLAMRLTSVGRPADTISDTIGQQIAARQLGAEDVCVIISGSGSNEASIRVARAAGNGGAMIIALTSFARSPLTERAGISLVIAPAATTFLRELEYTSRVAHAVFLEAFVAAVASALGPESTRVHAQVLEILSDNLADP